MKEEAIITNKTVYEKALFDEWSNKNHLLASEEYLFNKYISNKDGEILEAGTGGGRLAFYLEKLGCTNITSFDIVPAMIEAAKKRATTENSNTEFLVADACDLSQFKDESFDYSLYVQQVLNFIEKEDKFNKALSEAHRLTKTNGTVLFSFLDFDTRSFNPLLCFLVNSVRRLRNEKVRKQYLPWIKLGGKINWKFFNKNQPVCYWVKKDEMIAKLEHMGFKILEVKNQSTIYDEGAKRKGMLYIIAQKL